ncbi:MBOAT family protein [Bacteroidia bacterium]|jgi:D-alanyl-lipoteichoic acid acyltransferase DltB (MBOAT superfamily)|uniref:Membrane bound O-acyl transferase MBOAT family protein n=1 Tax=uncultured Flavobacteriia bacterium TaxID=212695 RepID=H6RIK3_9BACT|nr:O-acyltransferase [uncultured bacterium]MDB0055021.1 MBOAT family protein [Bacteroidia bacterium]MDC0105887.1 MBOAT family protein [Bacteroidia bacterium]CCG00944.1 membrane bound O-acyl transferase MBOAT family protein [uncultured Flavobacteriia bacterium]|tara:strand:+ start:2616 stop:4025 length:1410 start_codon:yes stop_codon:yes gene_type:complete
MLFQSFDFLVFFPLVFALFWAINKWNVLTRNIFLLAASYFFYGYWDYRFLALILSSSLVDFTIGILLHKTTKASARKGLLAFSVIFNIGLLGYCKYLNFFIENFVSALSSVGIEQDISTLQIILPVGISFYTFQTLSYTIDVYRKNIEPERNLVTFLTFVSFFPQLVAGPIERASNLLGQFRRKSEFTYSTGTEALRQILYGLIKKVIIADNCAIYANQAFANHDDLSSPYLILGAVFFAFQIYGDFSGYSDIARGVAKLLGFELMKNFNFPYFSKSIGEFWHRWHISLSTWFRDYIYIPLGGSRGSRWKTIRNIFIIFLVSGFWHGANWTFIIWGAVHAILFIPSIFFKKPADKSASGFRYIDIVKMLYTFSLVCLTWIFFRADSMQHALSYLSGIFSIETFQYNGFYFKFLPVLTVFILWEWFNRNSEYGWKLLPKSKVVRWFVYLFLICLILFFRQDDNAFIYFQF